MTKPVLIESPLAMKEEVVSLSPVCEKKESTLGLFSRLLRLDALGSGGRARGTSESDTPPAEPPTTYYGVYIPCEIKKGPDEEALHVYKDKEGAMELVRRYKQARFKTFRTMQDAVAFALRGADPDLTDSNTTTLMGEKPYPFKGPSPQDMVSLRKAIEAGLETVVRDRIWENPRYLVSSGNTPAILQEGSRYNALHVSAKALNADMCNLILTMVGDPDFVQRLYGMDADAATCREFASLLVDRYLNTPDKGLNETPLHFAAKYGAVEVVDVLTSFPQCNKRAVNKYSEQPKDVICKRNSGKDSMAAEKILRMLGERYYVPVFHSEDDSRQPTIGNIFTPPNAPGVNLDPLSPRLEIRAFAGPMEARDAVQFRRKWKTPPRAPASPATAPARHARGLVAPPAFRLNEISKGLESVGRNLAEEMNVGWKEYWPFLDTFTDFRTPEGLALLENYLRNEYQAACSLALYAYAVSNSAITSLPGSPEDASISKIMNISSSPIRDSPLTPISDLCVALKGCSIASNNVKPSRFREGLALSRARRLSLKSCQDTNGDHAPLANHMVSQLMCIERTCQVFAKRIADALNMSLSAEPDVVGESLKSEAKHLQHTIYSYMDDDRFKTIDFALIHSRLAQLVVLKLQQHTNELDDVNVLVEFLSKLRCPNDDIFSSDEDRKTSYRYSSRSKKVHAEVDSHVRCLASFISEELTGGGSLRGPSATQEECVAVWGTASKCTCEWARDNFERGNKRSASFRRNRRSILSSSPQGEVVKQLMFDHEIDDAVKGEMNCMSAWGDPARTLISINVDKCQVVPSNELISEDDSGKSSPEEEDEGEGYLTASENEADGAEERDGEEDKMADTSDQAAVEAFIYGDEPSKMDRLVYDAVAGVAISRDEFPHVYRWRHTVGLYRPEQRSKWIPSTAADDSVDTPVSYSFSLSRGVASSPTPGVFKRPLHACSSPVVLLDRSRTPRKMDGGAADNARSVPLQVSSWLRVTGPNSPRSALASKNVGHNVSFGF